MTMSAEAKAALRRIDVDAAGLAAGELLEGGDDGSEGVAVEGTLLERCSERDRDQARGLTRRSKAPLQFFAAAPGEKLNEIAVEEHAVRVFAVVVALHPLRDEPDGVTKIEV